MNLARQQGPGSSRWDPTQKRGNKMQEQLIAQLQQDFAACEELYNAFTEVDSPNKTAWIESLDTEQHEEAVTDLLEDARSAAVDSTDPSYVVAIMQGLSDLLTEVKSWVNSMYSDATGTKMPSGSAEQLETMVQEFRKSFNSAVALASNMPGILDKDAILTCVRTKSRKVKGNNEIQVPDLKTVRVRNRGVPRVGENNTKVKLVVDGEVVEADNLGMAVKSQGWTLNKVWNVLAERYPEYKSPWTKYDLYSDDMIEVDGVQVGLRKT